MARRKKGSPSRQVSVAVDDSLSGSTPVASGSPYLAAQAERLDLDTVVVYMLGSSSSNAAPIPHKSLGTMSE